MGGTEGLHLWHRSRGAANDEGDRHGHCEDLKCHVGLGFLVDDNDHNTLVAEDNATFCWDEEDLVHIAKWKKNKEQSMVNKKMDLVCYALEMVLGLCPSPIKDISDNPGFESCHGEGIREE